MSGQKVILIMFAGVLFIAVLTLVLYLTTRQLDSEEQEKSPDAGLMGIEREGTLLSLEFFDKEAVSGDSASRLFVGQG